MDAITVKVEGLSEVGEALAGLKKATARTQMRNALIAGGEITARAARLLAPVDEGGLKESINVGTRLSSRQASMHVPQAEVEVFIGPPSSPKAIVQEFGSFDQPPQAYMRPAWLRTRDAVLKRVSDEIIVRVEAAVARARKLALK